MFGTARPPSARELEELVQLTNRDPGSPAFVELGEAYIALGRPREAVEVGARGLRANPNSIDGRMMVSRALVQLHQWKEAQAELLKIVKADRNHKAGFLLLGEVLMRRGDYDRAIPVLQHAQNLDAGNPRVSDLLRRAQSQYPLDPPPPIPTPQQPAGMAPAGPPGGMAPSQFEDGEPTRVAEPLSASPAAPTVGLNAFAGPAGGPPPQAAAPPPQAAAPPQTAAPAPSSGAHAPAPGSGAFGQAEGGVRPRPRVLPAEKPKDAAQASLRQSAAAGENYLNNLLTSGLLDMPNVRAPEARFEIAAGKRWGRSSRRAFIFLFVLLFAGIGGGGYWYYYAAKQRAADVAKHLAQARELMVSASYSDLKAAVEESQEALLRDKDNVTAMAVYAKSASLLSLLYGVPADPVELALATVRKAVEKDGEGWQDYVIARAALTLSTLPELNEAKARLKDTRANLASWLEAHPDDLWARWLQGRALQAAGDYQAAREAFEKAEAEDGPVLATISVADVLLDHGDAEAALERYQAALERAPEHPLALMGQVLARIESGAEPLEISGEINVYFADKDYGPRLAAYQALAQAMSSYLIEAYDKFGEALDEAESAALAEPRYLARVGYGRLLQGKVEEAVAARSRVGWYGAKDPDRPLPLLTLLDAELLLTSGLPGDALEQLEGLEGLRARRLRGRALYDQGKAAEALAELDAALEMAPDDLEALLWREAARLAGASSRRDRRAADKELDKLARNSNSKMVRYVHGDALWRAGRTADARRKLESSVEELSVEYPNPLAYRAHVALAELDFAQDRVDAALEHLNKAAEQVKAYMPAQALMGRIQLSRGDHAEAAKALATVLEEPALATAAVELAFAEAVVSRSGEVSDAEREAARQAVRRAGKKDAPPEELARVAALVDPLLVEELGLDSGAGKKKNRRGRRRRRR